MEDLEADSEGAGHADALWRGGDWDAAAAQFERVIFAWDGAALPARVAWQFGALLYLRGDTARAEELLRSAHQPGESSADDALVSAWLGAALWRCGQVGEAAALAEMAHRQALRCGDLRAAAAAEVTRALVCASRGDRLGNVRAYRAALGAAEACGDVIQTGRILANLASKALEEGDYRAAVEHADRAVLAAELHKPIVGLALENKAAALIRLGSLDLARAAAAEAVAAYAAAGSSEVAAPELLLGEVYRLRGDMVQARLAFERALLSADTVQDAHQVAAACAGLAWVRANSDSLAASADAERAVATASLLERAAALNASAWVSLVTGEAARAAELAGQAEAIAQSTGDRWSLATALEIRAGATDQPSAELFSAALAIWADLGDRIAAARARLALAVVTADRRAAAQSRRELADLSAAEDVGVAGLLVAADEQAAVSITTLGRFAVTVAGVVVPGGVWQSRKARELLKLLAARGGRLVTRETVAEALWPGEAYSAASPRLSVLLTRLRAILDPGRRYPAEHYLNADKPGLALRTDRVRIDVVEFFATAADGAQLAREGRWEQAETLLRQAEQLYVGEFLSEDSDADWAVECRERARAMAVTCARLLARTAATRGEDEDAARWLLRLLERDPYDEDAWMALIAAHVRLRRHGEARHQHAVYTRRMRELDLPAQPLELIPVRLP